jgi:hypothetical protein
MGHSQGRKQTEITAAASVAQFLGITVSPSANAFRVSEVIQKKIDGLEHQIETLTAANDNLINLFALILTLSKTPSSHSTCSTHITNATQESPKENNQWPSKPSRRASRQAEQEEAA